MKAHSPTLPHSLPKTPKELFKLPLKDSIIYNSLIFFFKTTGLWKYPMRASGDVETMRFLDKVYWLYKTIYPIRKAHRNSGLEEFFEMQKSFALKLPDQFSPKNELTVSAVGDLINHAFLTHSKDVLYNQVSDVVFGADVTMANLECPIVLNSKKQFVFSFDVPPPLYYDAENFDTVKGIGDKKFTFLATACNHSLDFGTEGVQSTIQALQKDGIAYSGINASEEDAYRVTLIKKNGFTIGVVAYTFGLNAVKPPKDQPNIVNRMDLNGGVAKNDFDQFKKQIDYCKKERVDLLVAHLHWGLEHEFYPTPEQVELAHHVAELGVDVILGHHPHVIQPLEFYQTKRDPNRVVPVYYSLGNLINFFSAPYLCKSGVAQLTFSKGTLPDGTERVYIKSAKLEEVVQKVDESTKKVWLVPAKSA